MKDSELKSKIVIFMVVDAVISLFLSLFISTFMNDRLSFNPIRWIVSVVHYGFPVAMYAVLFYAVAGMALYSRYKSMQELEKDDRDFLYSKKGTYGTAKLLKNAKEIEGVARIQSPAYACGTILGQQDKSGQRLINQDMFNEKNHRNKHIAVFGASSSGKTYSFVKPFCIQAVRRRESLVITDPKGELYEDTAQYFRDNGYVVRRFDLKNLELSDGWDILSEIRGDANRAEILADVIWRNLGGGAESNVFDVGPVALLKALILRVALDDTMKQNGEQNIASVYDMLQNVGGEEYLNTVFDPAVLDKKTRVCVKSYMSFKQGSPNLRGSLLSGLSTKLGVFQSDLVCKIMSTPDIDLSLPGKVPCVYYCIMPDMYSTYNFLGATFFSFLFQDLVDYADCSPGRRCKVPVNFLFDEFANIGTIPQFDQKLATVRSRGLNVTIVLQDLPQLMTRYPTTYNSIISNCATYVCIGCNDEDTANFFSNRSGETTIQVRTDQHRAIDPMLKFGDPHSTGEGKRAIFTKDELMTFGMDECLIVWQALYTMKAYKYPYTSHPEASRMRKISILDYPSIYDEAGRAALRKKEAETIAEYERKRAEGWDPLAYFGAVREDVSDDELNETQRIFWYEKIRQKASEVAHNVRMALKPLIQKWYEMESRAKRNSMDDSTLICEGKENADKQQAMEDIFTCDVEDLAFDYDVQDVENVFVAADQGCEDLTQRCHESADVNPDQHATMHDAPTDNASFDNELKVETQNQEQAVMGSKAEELESSHMHSFASQSNPVEVVSESVNASRVESPVIEMDRREDEESAKRTVKNEISAEVRKAREAALKRLLPLGTTRLLDSAIRKLYLGIDIEEIKESVQASNISKDELRAMMN